MNKSNEITNMSVEKTKAEIISKSKSFVINSLFEQSIALIYIADIKTGKLLFANTAMIEASGYTEKEYLNISPKKIIHPEDIEKTFKKMEKVSQGQYVRGAINRHIRKDREVRTYKWSAAPDLEKELVFGIAIDITDIIINENKLKSRNSELEVFYEAAVNRELDMIELKKEINELLESKGEKPKYKIIR